MEPLHPSILKAFHDAGSTPYDGWEFIIESGPSTDSVNRCQAEFEGWAKTTRNVCPEQSVAGELASLQMLLTHG
jgi:hypothetical protein